MGFSTPSNGKCTVDNYGYSNTDDPNVRTYSSWGMYYEAYNPNNNWIVGSYWFQQGQSTPIPVYAWSRLKLVADSRGVKSFSFKVPQHTYWDPNFGLYGDYLGGSGYLYYLLLTEKYNPSQNPAFFSNSNKTKCTIDTTNHLLKGNITNANIEPNKKKYLYLFYKWTDYSNAQNQGAYGDTVTLYDIVDLTKPDVEIYDGTKFTRYEPYIYTGNGTNQGWKLAKPYIYTGKGINQGWKEAGN